MYIADLRQQMKKVIKKLKSTKVQQEDLFYQVSCQKIIRLNFHWQIEFFQKNMSLKLLIQFIDIVGKKRQ